MNKLNYMNNTKEEKFLKLLKSGNYREFLNSSSKELKSGRGTAALFKMRGIALSKLGEHSKALDNFRKMGKIGEQDQFLRVLMLQCDVDQRFKDLFAEYFKEGEKAETLFEIGSLLGLVNNKYSNFDSGLSYKDLSVLLLALLKLNGAAAPRVLAAISLRLFRKTENYQTLTLKIHDQKDHKSIDKTLSILNEDELFCTALEHSICADLAVEDLIIWIRQYLLRNRNISDFLETKFNLINSISLQCFLNEFIYETSKAEKDELTKLITLTKAEVEERRHYNWSAIAIISLYYDLNDFEWLSEVCMPQRYKKIYTAHIKNKKIELEYMGSLQSEEEINDQTSKLVRNQYERNPYPRWEIHPKCLFNRIKFGDFLNEAGCKIDNVPSLNKGKKSVLIAGSGTGQQPIALSQNVKNLDIEALDLSLASLAYAKRKTTELNIQNISYSQKDILNLKGSKKRYDYIECSGVLHHMKDPISGLQILTELLNVDGIMQVGLYSKYARQKLKKLQNFIKDKNVDPMSDDLLHIREVLKKAAPKGDFRNNWTVMGDFYSRSMFRDLLFHEMEHNFDLMEIRSSFKRIGLEFLGLNTKSTIHDKFKEMFPEQSAKFELLNWHEFEKSYPTAFVGMYHIFCKKLS